ncbi:hypothetical protein DFR55_12039 [Herbinix hemicellulosilytica]|uniref:Uncharacterized protein n=1 Tax=Herbinix hemicellulosilytica TaxID=1564487 RepID=A0A0H5SGM1_HERHM|nr:SIMPL domain-containing protein [Herbinix hemicellulosilytica]RBP57697.1 hypothetical protein DFR55_12039 [Herbinix hemicellulosilytica]CRZ34180.1 hypothetical protein HHT355_0977 [Herbinix hemicellulosilytica]
MFLNNNDGQINGNSIIVTGRGRITAVPDLAIIRLGVITSGEVLSDIQEYNARISQSVLNGLRNMGIEDIRTYRYLIDKIYEFENNLRIDRGYSVQNMFEIQTGMLDTVGTVIDVAVSLGANLVESISFEVSTIDQYYLEALRQALLNGIEKASVMAEVFNTRPDPVPKRIVENSLPVPLSRTFFRDELAATPIEPGTTNIEAVVTMEFGYS